MRSWTPANSSHSPQRRRPTCGWTSGHGSVSWPGDGPGRPLDDPLALGDLAEQRLAVRVRRARDPLDDRRGVVRPAAGGRERRRQAQPDPRLAGVPDALGDVPVALAAGRPEDGLGERLDERGERVGHRRELGHDGRRAARSGALSDLASDGDQLALLDAAPRRDDVRRAGFERLDPGVAHSRRRYDAGSARKSRVIVT